MEHTGDNAVTEGSGDAKVKRKKLKGKRAVVRWLKFFRWKKKKDYERMTTEEKILYKLRKVIFHPNTLTHILGMSKIVQFIKFGQIFGIAAQVIKFFIPNS